MTVYLSLAAERAVATAFHSVALISTVFRLYRRHKQKNLWWDDGWAFVAFLFDIIYCSTIVLREERPTMTPHQRYRQIVVFWIAGTLPPLIVWFSRISICLSIAKIDMQIAISRIRTLFYCLMMTFGLVAAAMLLQRIWMCAWDISWHDAPVVQCYPGDIMGFISLIGDVVADTALAVVFLNLTWRVRLRRSQRKLLSVIALANCLSSMAGIVYGVTEVQAEKLGASRGYIMALIVHIKAATTMVVSNLLIVITYLYSIFCRSSGSSHERTDSTPVTGRRVQGLRDAVLNKSTPMPHRTFYILTQFDSNGSVIPYSQQGGLTGYTWAGSEMGWVPRPPSTVFTRSEKSSSFSPNSRNDSPPPELSRVLPQPSPRRPPNVYSSPIVPL